MGSGFSCHEVLRSSSIVVVAKMSQFYHILSIFAKLLTWRSAHVRETPRHMSRPENWRCSFAQVSSLGYNKGRLVPTVASLGHWAEFTQYTIQEESQGWKSPPRS